MMEKEPSLIPLLIPYHGSENELRILKHEETRRTTTKWEKSTRPRLRRTSYEPHHCCVSEFMGEGGLSKLTLLEHLHCFLFVLGAFS